MVSVEKNIYTYLLGQNFQQCPIKHASNHYTAGDKPDWVHLFLNHINQDPYVCMIQHSHHVRGIKPVDEFNSFHWLIVTHRLLMLNRTWAGTGVHQPISCAHTFSPVITSAGSPLSLFTFSTPPGGAREAPEAFTSMHMRVLACLRYAQTMTRTSSTVNSMATTMKTAGLENPTSGMTKTTDTHQLQKPSIILSQRKKTEVTPNVAPQKWFNGVPVFPNGPWVYLTLYEPQQRCLLVNILRLHLPLEPCGVGTETLSKLSYLTTIERTKISAPHRRNLWPAGSKLINVEWICMTFVD